METKTETIDDFLDKLSVELPDTLKHDFIAKAQADFLQELKEKLVEGEFLVTLDFSENHSLEVQDAIQSQHWNKIQVTLHVYVIYYRKNNKSHHLNFVVFSEYREHDATGVHLYNSKMIEFLKIKLGRRSVKKIFYYSDGASSQYKNKSNFLNLVLHEKDFGATAEWHFFATSHGKGACDGIGGSVKRLAYRACLQDKPIGNIQQLYEWARGHFKNIYFELVLTEEYNAHKEKLKSRLSAAKTIIGTRQYHCYKPIDQKTLDCKIFSKYPKSVVQKVC